MGLGAGFSWGSLFSGLGGPSGQGGQLKTFNSPMPHAAQAPMPNIPSPFEAISKGPEPASVQSPFEQIKSTAGKAISYPATLVHGALGSGGKAPTNVIGDDGLSPLPQIIQSNPGYVPGPRESTNVEDRRHLPLWQHF